jgi:hypothetical protein
MPRLQGVTVKSNRRLINSQNGNPRFVVQFSDGTTAETERDAAVNYDVTNVTGKPIQLDVELTAAGKIVRWEPSA